MVPPAPRSVEHALIVSPVDDAKYFGKQCEEKKCEWTTKYYEALKAKIEAVPAGELREQALALIKPLGEEPFAVDEMAAERRQVLTETSDAATKAYPARLAETLIKTGCDGRGAPYVIRGLLRQLSSSFLPFTSGDPQQAAVAKAFLESGLRGCARPLRRRQSEAPPLCRPAAEAGRGAASEGMD